VGVEETSCSKENTSMSLWFGMNEKTLSMQFYFPSSTTGRYV